MGFSREQLIHKALMALEDAVQECRYRQPRRSLALRFALAYLWSQSGAERRHFDALWAAIGAEKSPWSYSVAENALGWVYRAVGVARDDAVANKLWQEWSEREGRSSTP